MNNKQTMNTKYERIDFFEMANEILKRWWIILLAAVFGAAVMFAITKYCITPLYQSSVLFYVNNGQKQPNEKISNADITASQSLVDTYIVILEHGTTLDEVIADAGLDYTTSELRKKLTCGAIDKTEVFRVTVTDPSPETATLIASSISKILPDKVSSVIEGSTVRIVREANTPTSPSSPNLRMNMLLGALLCSVLCILFIALRFVFDDRIRNTTVMLQEHYPYPVLAVIPDLLSSSDEYYYQHHAKER